MISPIRSLCFNDDHQTFTVVLPSQYRIFRCDPFGMIFSRECEDLSLGSVATYNGYRLLALTGSPSPPIFNSKCIKIFDHQTGLIPFEHTFDDHILCMRLGQDIVCVYMNVRVEIWSTSAKKQLFRINVGLNVHCPIAISPDSGCIIVGGENEKYLTIINKDTRSSNYSSSKFIADNQAVSLVSFSQNGQAFASAAFNGSNIKVWETKTQNLSNILERKQSGDIVQTMDFSPDHGFIATCSRDGLVRIFDIRKKQKGAVKEIAPICTAELTSSSITMTMPRISWLSSTHIGVTSLEGDFYKLTFNGATIEMESTPFLKRPE